MTVTFSLPTDVGAKLRDAALRNGLTPDEFARRLVEQTVDRPTVEQLLAPYRRQVAESGLSDSQLDDLHREMLDESRRERRAGRP